MRQRSKSRTMGRLLALALLSATCCAISGCIARQEVVEKTFVVIHAGKPMQILAGGKKVTGRTIEGEQHVAEQDVSGWVTMPPDHYRVIKRKLQESLEQEIEAREFTKKGGL